MDKSLRFRFIVAALSIGIGCWALLAHWPGLGIFFTVATLVTLPQTERTRAVPARELGWMAVGLLAFVALMIICKWLMPASVNDALGQVVHHPAFVVPFALLMWWCLYQGYRRQQAGQDDISISA